MARSGGTFDERTAWVRRLETPLRRFLDTERSGASILVAAAVAALLWANLDSASYEDVWHTELAITLGSIEGTVSSLGLI